MDYFISFFSTYVLSRETGNGIRKLGKTAKPTRAGLEAVMAASWTKPAIFRSHADRLLFSWEKVRFR